VQDAQHNGGSVLTSPIMLKKISFAMFLLAKARVPMQHTKHPADRQTCVVCAGKGDTPGFLKS
jgi:hypothetical protein